MQGGEWGSSKRALFMTKQANSLTKEREYEEYEMKPGPFLLTADRVTIIKLLVAA